MWGDGFASPYARHLMLGYAAGSGYAPYVRGFLCATFVSFVALWWILPARSSTTETQRTRRLHREQNLGALDIFLSESSS